jgi:hypothetical protein
VTAVAARPTPALELGHPVRSFVVALVGIALLLLVVQWSGFANPRLSPTHHSGTHRAGPTETFSLQIRNDAPLPVEIVAIEWPTTNVASQEVGITPSAGGADDAPLTAELLPFEPFTLEGGETAWLGIRVAPECSATIGDPTIDVRTRSGLRHDVEIPQGSQNVGDPCEPT